MKVQSKGTNRKKITFRLAVGSIDQGHCIPECLSAVAAAADRGADLLLLPEEPDKVAGRVPYRYPLEKHPVFLQFQKAARRYKMPIISTLSVKVGPGKANLGFLLDARGETIGVYNKKHPAPSEEGIDTSPLSGDPFPVLDLNGVKIALAICMDIHFPEMFQIYSLKKADLICVSTRYLDYTGDMLESLEKARAIDSQAYVAISRYIKQPFLAGRDMGYAKVIAPDGRIIASTGHQPGIAIAEFDPRWRFPTWYEGDLLQRYPEFRTLFNKLRKPQYYGELIRTRKEIGPK